MKMVNIIKLICCLFSILFVNIVFAQKTKKTESKNFYTISAGYNLSSVGSIGCSARINYNKFGVELTLPSGNKKKDFGNYSNEITKVRGGASLFFYLKPPKQTNFYFQLSACDYYSKEYQGNVAYHYPNYTYVEKTVIENKINTGLLFGVEYDLYDTFKVKAAAGYSGYNILSSRASYFLGAEIGMYFIIKQNL